MIHDFATHSKCNHPAEILIEKRMSAAPVMSPVFTRRQIKVIAIAVALTVTLSISVYSRTKTDDATLAEFAPGVEGVQQYQKETVFPETEKGADHELHSAVNSHSFFTKDLDEVATIEGETQEQVAFEAAVNSESESEVGYGFYDFLQASTWDIPVQKGIYITEDDLKRATYTYMLQAASMRSRADAIALVRKLKEMGMKATYTKSRGSYGDTWYRVNVGPFSDVSVMNKAEDRLVAMRMMPLKRRIK